MIAHRNVATNGIRLHIAEAGEGPLVVLCHGFPESWYSWRHQLQALAEAGYHAVAPDMRGYGRTSRPVDVAAYTTPQLVGDVVGLVQALGEERAVVVGHDWGAPVAWHAALLRPDMFRGVVALSVPYRPRGPIGLIAGLRAIFGDGSNGTHYMLHFQEPGVAEAELEADVRAALRGFLYAASGDAPPDERFSGFMAPGQSVMDVLTQPEKLPPWISEDDIDVYAGEFERTGFIGGLNWYRAADLSWEHLSPFAGARIDVPALFVAGDEDVVVKSRPEAVEHLPAGVPGLVRPPVLLPGCGHWTQQERAGEVNELLLEFLAGLD